LIYLPARLYMAKSLFDWKRDSKVDTMTKALELTRNAAIALAFDACMATLAIVLFIKAH
jgi:hypothetical protein